jgi:hypothetical protein
VHFPVGSTIEQAYIYITHYRTILLQIKLESNGRHIGIEVAYVFSYAVRGNVDASSPGPIAFPV